MANNIQMEALFEPKDEVEIIQYLLKRVKGEQLPSYYNVITTDSNLHNHNAPWREQFIDKTGEDDQKTLYFFAKLNKKKTETPPSSIERNIGGGESVTRWIWTEHWDSPMSISNKDFAIIGTLRTFGYVPEIRSSAASTNCERWVMFEYHLDGIYEEFTHLDDYVMCKITKENDLEAIPRHGQQQQSPCNFLYAIDDDDICVQATRMELLEAMLLNTEDAKKRRSPNVHSLPGWDEFVAESPEWIKSLEAPSDDSIVKKQN